MKNAGNSTELSGGAPTDRQPAISIRGLVKEYPGPAGPTVALRETDLTIFRGEFVCIVGPSGCGKTTLLNILGGLVEATRGEFVFEPGPQEHRISIAFQEQSVFPWMTVLENAAFGLMARGVPAAERQKKALEVLTKMHLAPFSNAYPRQLSGGMRQRVNVARAFCNEPSILLMDEPFAALDEQTKLILQNDLLEVWERSGQTVVFITHSIDEAIRLSDRILVMTARPGRVKATIQVPFPRPRDVFALQTEPEFIELRRRVWDALKEEVLAVQADELRAEGKKNE
ncbi:MAG: ABC transporter ATP-binding protein [Devosia sp.]|nr:ABC transporter ATP-binding protein [Devosia sp.]